MKKNRIIAFVLALMTVVAMASALGASASPYKDVADNRWSCADIIYASEKGYMNGVGDGKFNPAGVMKRAMIVTVLYRMEGSPEVTYRKAFNDVPEGNIIRRPFFGRQPTKSLPVPRQSSFLPTVM